MSKPLAAALLALLTLFGGLPPLLPAAEAATPLAARAAAQARPAGRHARPHRRATYRRAVPRRPAYRRPARRLHARPAALRRHAAVPRRFRHQRRPAALAPRPLLVAHGRRPPLSTLRLPAGPALPPVSPGGARPAGRSPAPPPAPALVADAAGAQALAQALGLPAGALARIAAHGQVLAGAADAAKAVAAAEATRAALFDALAPRLASADPAERQLVHDLLRALGQALPGVAVRLPADRDAPPEAGVDYAALARALPAGAPGRELLAVAGSLLSPFGPPGYLREAGLTPCADFGRVNAALAKLPGAWQAAPGALRARLQRPLRDAVVRMGEQADFCPEERRARLAAREAARHLGRLPAFGGPGTGKRIGHNFRSYGLRFGLDPAEKP